MGYLFVNVKTAEWMFFHGGYENSERLLLQSRLMWVTMGVL